MGIINVTPDSFSDGGDNFNPDKALETALELESNGADIIDVGGESTRPGAQELSVAEELDRILPVIRRLSSVIRVPISIDTYKAEVARQAIDNGATVVNDVSGLSRDPDLAAIVAKAGIPIILMHSRGPSSDMYRNADYDDVMIQVIQELTDSINKALSAGISREQVIVDPGLGFAKKSHQTFQLLAGFDQLTTLDRPILIGSSRKSFLKEALGECMPLDREWGTAATVAYAVFEGAHIVRVHGLREMSQVVQVAERLRQEAESYEDS